MNNEMKPVSLILLLLVVLAIWASNSKAQGNSNCVMRVVENRPVCVERVRVQINPDLLPILRVASEPTSENINKIVEEAILYLLTIELPIFGSNNER